MRLRMTGRAQRMAAVTMAVVLLAAILALAGCGRHAATTGTAPADATAAAPGDGSAQGGSYQNEAERTRAMEAKARELDQKAAEIQNMQGTEQEKIDAVNKLEQERQELNKMGGDGSTSANPPPQ